MLAFIPPKRVKFTARNPIEFEPRYGDIDVFAEYRSFSGGYILKNSFGLGGVNASLLVKLI